LGSRSSLVLLVCLAAGAARADGDGAVAGKVSLVKLSTGSHLDSYDDVLVYLEDAPNVGKMPEGPFVVTQVAKSFRPEVLVVPVGAKVDFPNQDQFFHNVFSTSSGNSFDLGLYKGGASKSVVFQKPGAVPIFCNIHPQMISYIVVLTNPFFVHPDNAGHFRFAGVPPGSYHIVTWMPYGSAVREEVKVEAGGTTEVHVRLSERSGALRHPNKEGKPYTHY
jgi:plastocyanin